MPKAIFLQLAIYADNISVSAHGIIPMLLGFGMLPKIPGVSGTGSISQDEHSSCISPLGWIFSRNIVHKRIELGLKEKRAVSQRGRY